MQRIVIETNWVFQPSKKCLEMFFERKDWEYEVTECDEYGGWIKYCEPVVNGERYHIYAMPRDDPDFVAVVEELGDEAGIKNGRESSILKIVDIPDGVEWDVIDSECSHGEYIEEKHRIWE